MQLVRSRYLPLTFFLILAATAARLLLSWNHSPPVLGHPDLLATLPPGTINDPQLIAFSDPTTRNQARETYKAQMQQAVPALLANLQSPHPEVRIVATRALFYAWSEEAISPLLDQLKKHDPTEAESARRVLIRHVDTQRLDAALEQILHEISPEIVAAFLERNERFAPDESRIDRLARDKRYWEVVLPYLPRYSSRNMFQRANTIAHHGSGQVQAHAIAAMIHSSPITNELRRTIPKWLKSTDPLVREHAAEYCRWHGGSSELAPIRYALSTEADRYTRASLQAALAAISKRPDKRRFPPAPRMEPVFKYGVSSTENTTQSVERIRLLRSYAGYPHPAHAAPVPKAVTLLAPTRDFWESSDRSFGFSIPSGDGPFAASTHVGDDVSWWEDFATVVATAPGVVRYMRVAATSWGGIVVLEHTRPDGSSFCSLYSHLGPLICVREGDTVLQGQKLGSLGRSHTLENGGYGCHLHFGLHEGPYHSGHWISGYVGHHTFRSGRHQWIRPRDVIPPPPVRSSD